MRTTIPRLSGAGVLLVLHSSFLWPALSSASQLLSQPESVWKDAARCLSHLPRLKSQRGVPTNITPRPVESRSIDGERIFQDSYLAYAVPSELVGGAAQKYLVYSPAGIQLIGFGHETASPIESAKRGIVINSRQRDAQILATHNLVVQDVRESLLAAFESGRLPQRDGQHEAWKLAVGKLRRWCSSATGDPEIRRLVEEYYFTGKIVRPVQSTQDEPIMQEGGNTGGNPVF